MDKTKVVKFVLGVVVSAGATKVVGGFVKNNTNPKNMRDKFTIVVASMVMGSLVIRYLKDHSDEMVDEAIEAFENLRQNTLDLQAVIAGDE